MPTTYTGNQANPSPSVAVPESRSAPAFDLDVGSDVPSVGRLNTAYRTIANYIAWLRTKAGVLDIASTWTAAQTFNNILLNAVTSLTAPAADGIRQIAALNQQSTGMGAYGPFRVYYADAGFVTDTTPFGGIILVWNASWDEGLIKWMPDVLAAGASCIRLSLSSPGISLYTIAASGTGWTTFGSPAVQLSTLKGLSTPTAGGLVAGHADTVAGSPNITVNNTAATTTSRAFAIVEGVDASFKYITRCFCFSGGITIEGNANATSNGVKVAWFLVNDSAP